jgi:cytochrome P450
MARSTVFRWMVQSVGPQMMLRRAAKNGELGARLAIDRRLWADPFPTYERMRAIGEMQHGGLVSSTTSHKIASEVLRSPSFRVGIGSSERLSPLARRMMAMSTDPDAVGPAEPPSMLAVDPPQHTKYRRLVSKVFTARRMAAMEPRVEAIAGELLDEMERRGGVVDLVDMYAGPLPVRVISEILGVPAYMQDSMLEWGNAAAVTLDPALHYRQFRNAARALRRIHSWLDNHLQELRRNPGDDLLSKLAVLVDEGESLDDVELRSTALLVIGAGFETTVNLIGNAVTQLFEHRDQLDALKADPSGWPNAVDEVLRYDSPVQVTVRVAGEDTNVCGHDIPAGRFVSLMLGGANRDPEVFSDPARFDVTRDNARDHLGFSAGIHFCLGASLARLEGAVALRMLFERFPDLTLAGDPVRRELRVLRGYEHLPVSLRGSAVHSPALDGARKPNTIRTSSLHGSDGSGWTSPVSTKPSRS